MCDFHLQVDTLVGVIEGQTKVLLAGSEFEAYLVGNAQVCSSTPISTCTAPDIVCSDFSHDAL